MHNTKSFDDWLTHIQCLTGKDIDLGIDKLMPLVGLLPKPTALCTITIAGTNGKGTTAHLLAEVLTQHGFNVVLYTSPHVHDFRERLQVNGQFFSEIRWIDAFEWVARHCDFPLTFFEYTTFAAIKMAYDCKPDVLILEVGLGGLHDVVNCFEPDVSVITSIGLDHQDYLGQTLADIAIQKAGIYRTGRPAIYASKNIPDGLRNHCQQRHIALMRRDHAFTLTCLDPEKSELWRWQQGTTQHVFHKPAMMHPDCLAAACQVLSVLAPQFPIVWTTVQKVVASFQLMGRFERMALRHADVVLDVAHNPASCHVLAENLQTYYPKQRRCYMAGFGRDKDALACLKKLHQPGDKWCFLPLQHRPCHAPKMLHRMLQSMDIDANSCWIDDVLIDPALVLAHDKDNTVIVVVGSFLIVDPFRKTLQKTIAAFDPKT